jgi:hypothetical protein
VALAAPNKSSLKLFISTISAYNWHEDVGYKTYVQP